MPSSCRPASRVGGDEAVDHLAADRDDHDALARAGRGLDDARAARSRGSPRPSASGCGRAPRRGRRRRAPSSSSSGGRSIERTTMRWLATPRRTRVGRSCSAKNAFSASASAAGSVTSPSRRMPGRSSATAPRLTVMRAVDADLGGRDVGGVEVEPDHRVLFLRFGCLSTMVLSAAVAPAALGGLRPAARARCSGRARRCRRTARSRRRWRRSCTCRPLEPIFMHAGAVDASAPQSAKPPLDVSTSRASSTFWPMHLPSPRAPRRGAGAVGVVDQVEDPEVGQPPASPRGRSARSAGPGASLVLMHVVAMPGGRAAGRRSGPVGEVRRVRAALDPDDLAAEVVLFRVLGRAAREVAAVGDRALLEARELRRAS